MEIHILEHAMTVLSENAGRPQDQDVIDRDDASIIMEVIVPEHWVQNLPALHSSSLLP